MECLPVVLSSVWLRQFPEALLPLILFSIAWFVVGYLAGRHMALRRAGSDDSAEDSSESRHDSSDELYVGNLPYEVSDHDLKKAFRKFGKVVSTRVIANKGNGKSKGFGFVAMAASSQCDAAIKGMHGKELGGRKLVVNRAK